MEKCTRCDGSTLVCENHDDRPWDGVSNRSDACGCGAGKRCPDCWATVDDSKERGRAVSRRNGKSISNGGNDAPPREQAIANMHLIAAAPDMYEALAAFVGMQSTDDVNAIIGQAEAALAKARGEST